MHINVQKISCSSFVPSSLPTVFKKLCHKSHQKISQNIKPFIDLRFLTLKMVYAGKDGIRYVQDKFVAKSNWYVVRAELLQNKLFCAGDVLMKSCPYLPLQLFKPEIETPVIFQLVIVRNLTSRKSGILWGCWPWDRQNSWYSLILWRKEVLK